MLGRAKAFGNRRMIYSVSTSSIHCEEITQFRNDFITPEDHTNAARYRTESGQIRSLAARALLRALLNATTGISGRSWILKLRPDGRTVASANELNIQPRVSVSHSLSRVACAVSLNGNIGVDIEHCRRDRDFLSLAEFAFADPEINAVRENGASAFYRIWTMREAVAKASGLGLFATLGCCTIASAPSSGSTNSIVVLNHQRFVLEHRCLPDGYMLGLAVELDAK